MTWYIIIDLDNFIKQTRIMSFSKFKESNEAVNDSVTDLLVSEKENLDKMLSEKEAELIIMPHLKIHEENKYKVSEKTFMSILESLNSRIISNILQDLASRDIIEMAYDSNINDFVFWMKEKPNKEKSNKEKNV